jgi:hypothetical protein
MARAIAAGVAVGAAIAACFSTPPRPGGVPDDGAVNGDGIRIDASGDGGVADSSEADAMPGCTSELFTASGTGCGPNFVGSGFGPASIGRASSQLHLALTGTSAGSASCRLAPIALNRVTFDIADVIATSAGESTFVGFIAGNGSAYGVEISWIPTDSAIDVEPICPGVATFPLPQWDPAQHFVRLTRNTSSGMTDITITRTPDGGDVSDVSYQCSGTAQFNAAEITMIVYRGGTGATGSARIETLEHCP